MPDWRKASDYQFTHNLPNYRWAWEFLRRNKEYRVAWSAMLVRLLARSDEFVKFPRYIEHRDGGISWTGARTADPDDPEFYAPIPERDQWFLVRGLLNPATDNPSALSFSVGFGTMYFFREDWKHQLAPAGLRYPWAVFDLGLPLKPQIDSVLSSLELEQQRGKVKPRRVRHHREKWPHYLRLLDADLDGRTPKYIADTLQHEIDGITEKKVWDQLRAARRMTQPEQYRSIFLSSENKASP